ncbi:MAG: hypothetical protein ACOYXA_10955 [Bacteroidota bacterium]
MKLAIIIGLALGLVVSSSSTQSQNFWHVLAEVGYQIKNDKNGYQVEVPVFSKNLRGWDGKKIKLKGFVIPVNEVGDHEKFMLSSLPFNVCYFCGAAGPETVVEVEATEPVRFSSKAIWMEGILELNDRDPDRHMYILKMAQVISPPTAGAYPETPYFSR